MPNLKHLIPESRKLLGSTISDLLNKFLTFNNKTLIMFDIETLGLNPSFDYEQITELAAYAFCGNSKKLIDKINFKVKLSETATEFLNNNDSIQRYNWEKRQLKRGKTAFTDPNEILKMTRYHEIDSEIISEQFAIDKFYKFVNNFDKPILVAHNADFDVKFVFTRGNIYQLNFPFCEILDTLRLSQFFFVPLVETLQKTKAVELYESLSRENKKGIHISSRLGDLAKSFKIDATSWHSAKADVKMMNEVMFCIIDFLKKHEKTDITLAQEKAIKKTYKARNYQRKRKTK